METWVCMLQAPTWVVMLVKSAFTPIKIVKGAGLFQSAGRTKGEISSDLYRLLLCDIEKSKY